VARRYDVNANQVFNWLKEPRFADAEPPEPEPFFLPLEITGARDLTVPSENTEPGTLEIVAVHSYETRALRVHAAAGSGASCAALTAAGVW
jgi:transposase-like protein